MNNLIIKGAYYYDHTSDQILIPHFTGEFYVVDCDRYETIENLKERYNDDYIEEVEENYIMYNDVKYYYAEYHPETVEDWELLSDLSELSHIECEFDFE